MTTNDQQNTTPFDKKLRTDDKNTVNQALLLSRSHIASRIELSIAKERLRQARCSFNLALVATGTSALVGLIGAGLLLSDRVTEGAVTAMGGLVSSACCVKFAKDSNDRLDKILRETHY